MSTGKLFAVTLAAVIVGNLATLGILSALRDVRVGELGAWMERVGSGHLLPGQSGVTFRNTSDNRVRCWIKRAADEDYTPVLVLHGRETKTFPDFPTGASGRCSFDIGPGTSTTLSYFAFTRPGTYDLILDRVPCPACKGRDWRWATVVVDPAGHSDYNRLSNRQPITPGTPPSQAPRVSATDGETPARTTDRYIPIIQDRIRQHWVRPRSAPENLVSVVALQLVPGGEVVADSVRVITSSGNEAFDAAVVSAVYLASPLPVPEGKAFENFREFNLRFSGK